MKRYLPLVLSALLTAALAGLVAWRQQVRMDGLREKIAARAALVKSVSEPVPVAKPPAPAPAAAKDLASVLSRTKSRSMLRTGQELVHYYQTCPLAELRAALEELARTARIGSLEAAGAFMIAMSALTERDTAAAVEIAGKMQGDPAIPATMIVLNDWMTRDKKAALAWFHGMKDQKLKGTVLTAASVFYGASNPQLVEEIRNGVPDDGVRDKAASAAIEALAIADPEAALARMDELADPDRRRSIEQTAFMGLGRKSPEKALGMMRLDAAPEDRRVEDGDAARVLLHFIKEDRQAAEKWMAAQAPAVIARLLAADPSIGTAAPNPK